MYGYPTIRNVSIAPQQNYLCVSHRAEREWVQPLRLVAGLYVAPYLYKISQIQDDPKHRQFLFATSLGLGSWALMVWYNANKQMNKAS
jgi:hypothetical protein